MTAGRPREFDPDVALDRALSVFWANGYEATSTSDLMEAMSLSKSSLYQSFGSKEQLFRRCLERYGEETTRFLRSELERATSAKQFLVDLFQGRLEHWAPDAPGCLYVNTACEFGASNPAIAALLNTRIESQRQVLQEAIERAQRDGTVPDQRDARDLSNFLIMSLCGLKVMEKRGCPDRDLDPIVAQVLAQLD